jgi:hypothetical protein
MALLASLSSKGAYAAIPTSSASAGAGAALLPAPGGLFTHSLSAQLAALSLPAKAALVTAAIATVAGAAVGIAQAARPVAPNPSAGLCSYGAYRLPAGAFVPSAYRVYWAPRFSAPFTYAGAVDIDLTVAQDADCILVHSGADLAYSYVASAGLPGGPFQPVASWAPDAANERIVLRLPQGTVAAGSRLTLRFNYSSPLRTNNNGLYLSTFLDDAGRTVNMTATQFEATAARQAFPCFDEPALKATFSLAVDGVPAGYTAVSNMPVAATAPASPGVGAQGATLVSFAQTPRMSTYLLALVVGPMISSSATFDGTKPVTSYGVARNATAGRLAFATGVAALIIPYYEQLFEADFPLPKMDMLAIPDFAAGAMENWQVRFAKIAPTSPAHAHTPNPAANLSRPSAGAASPTARPLCSRTPSRRRRPSGSAWPSSSRTSSRTSGAATS